MAEDKKYYSIITDAGTAKVVLSIAEGRKVNLTKFAVGDGGGSYYQPTRDMMQLKGEKFRGNIKSYEIDSLSPNIAVIKAILPYSVGGWTVREMGVFDEDGILIGIGNMPDMEKVAAESGASYEMELTMRIAVSNIEQLEFKFDPVTILLTKRDLDAHDKDSKAHEEALQPLIEHIENHLVHVTPELIENLNIAASDLVQHVGNYDIHILEKERAEWNTGKTTADEAFRLAKANSQKSNINESRIQSLEDAIYNNITGNPFSIGFNDLNGVILTKGNWNKIQQRIEC